MAVGNGAPEQLLQRTNGTAMHSEAPAEAQTSAAKPREAPSTSGQAAQKLLTGQRAVSQQTSVDLSSTGSPFSKVRIYMFHFVPKYNFRKNAHHVILFVFCPVITVFK